jgi:hypothetical protein
LFSTRPEFLIQSQTLLDKVLAVMRHAFPYLTVKIKVTLLYLIEKLPSAAPCKWKVSINDEVGENT